MSALAKYFISNNINVYGYDRESSFITKDLKTKGAKIYHDYLNIDFVQLQKDLEETLIIYTPAFKKNHPLILNFVSKGFDIFKRSEIIEKISKNSKCIAIAGSHGKTTTSAILAHIFCEAKYSFLAFVGGIMENYQSNYIFNGDEYIIVEADEFDKSFLKLKPAFACITSIDNDHLDTYNNLRNLTKAFKEFENNIESDGFLISFEDVKINSLKYGIKEHSNFKAANIKYNNKSSIFDLHLNDRKIENVEIGLPGLHNIMNTVAAISIALEVGIAENIILRALTTFKGVNRRFSYRIDEDSLVLIDDYAHHPKEINNIYLTLKSIYPKDELLVIFQPHLFTRTRDLLNDFAAQLSKFDAVILLEIYAAREESILGINSNLLLSKISLQNKFLCDKSDISSLIKSIGFKVNVILGAGDISNEVEQIKKDLHYAI